MTIRDLGYKPYEGARVPPSNNTWVLLRQGVARAWGSWLLKIAVFISIFPPLVACLALGTMRYFAEAQGQGDQAGVVNAGSDALRYLFTAETWFVVSLVTLGGGAGAIAEDLTFKAFQFYFSKPVTAVQYLLGRIGAVAIFIFVLVFSGSLLVVMVAGVTAAPEHRVDDFLLVLPVLAYSLILAVFMSSASVSVSALGASRALTMSAWGLLFVVPHVIASIVDRIAQGEFPWLYLASFTGLLGTVADALFKVESESDLKWFHAAPVLALIVGLGVFAAHARLVRTEVIK